MYPYLKLAANKLNEKLTIIYTIGRLRLNNLFLIKSHIAVKVKSKAQIFIKCAICGPVMIEKKKLQNRITDDKTFSKLMY